MSVGRAGSYPAPDTMSEDNSDQPETLTNEELLRRVLRGTYPISYEGSPPNCSNCGCSESIHNQPPKSWPDHKGCDNHKDESYCWGGFDLAPGGTSPNVCTHRNGCKSWCTYMDEVIAQDAEENKDYDLAALIRSKYKQRVFAYGEQLRRTGK